MKILAAVPCALLVVSLLGCSQQESTAPAAAPAPDSTPGSTQSRGSDTNTFGESKDPGAQAAQAREHSWGDSDQSSSGQSSTQDSGSQPTKPDTAGSPPPHP